MTDASPPAWEWADRHFSLAAVRPLGSLLTHPHVLHKSLPKVHSSHQIRYPLVHWSHAERFLLLPEEASSRYY
jgi:hypothetical protein